MFFDKVEKADTFFLLSLRGAALKTAMWWEKVSSEKRKLKLEGVGLLLQRPLVRPGTGPVHQRRPHQGRGELVCVLLE
jgi:hypothetical protein